MIFGPVPVAEAEGAVLAHGVSVYGRKIAKGTVLTAADLRDLVDAGHAQITVAQLAPQDIAENDAATQAAAALVPEPDAAGLRVSGAGSGRVNLYATGPGVVVLDRTAIDAFNTVDPMITVATVPAHHRVEAGTMVATVKIISYAVDGVALEAACTEGRGSLRVAPPRYATATLIETVVGEGAPSDKGRNAIEARLTRLGVTLGPRVIVPHEVAALGRAVAEAPGQVVLILTASATSDVQDVAPQALRAAGGTVSAFGMPVDPGNLLFFGTRGQAGEAAPVIGLPGCARSPALNGADWVLERLVCGITLTQADISRMGVGGLLKEIPTRPKPRAQVPQHPQNTAS